MAENDVKNTSLTHTYKSPHADKRKISSVFTKDRNKLIALAFVLVALPITVGLALTQQNYLNFASGSDISRVDIHPGVVSANAETNGRPVAMSALAYDSNGNPINEGVSYMWTISSEDGLGSLTKTTGDLSEFIPGNQMGCGQLVVTATLEGKSVTKGTLVEVYRGSSFPACAGHSKALYLDGNSWVEFPDGSKKLDFNQDFTIEMWVFPEVVRNNYMPILAREFDRSGISSRFYFMDLDHYSDEAKYEYQGEVGGENASTNMIMPAMWTHLALVRENKDDGNYEIKGYVNGELKFTKFAPISQVDIPSSQTTLGRLIKINDGGRFNGQVDQIRVSQAARNIPENWASGVYQRPLSLDSSTVSLWEFEDNLQDSSGNGANGVATGQIYYTNSFILSPQFTPIPTKTPTVTPTDSPTPSSQPTDTPTPTPSSQPTYTPTPTPTTMPGNKVVTLMPTADAFVRSNQINKNFGTNQTVDSLGNPITIGFFKFNLKSLAGKTIIKATLNLNVSDVSVSSQALQRANDKNWGETTITYATRPASVATIRTFIPSVGSLSLPVTSPVSAKSGSTVTFMISSSGSDKASFYSRESGVKSPTLTVEYK